MPVIIGYKDRALQENLPFVYKVDSDESPINIKEIRDKYFSMKIENSEIRQYAINNLSWDSQIKKIVKQLK